MQIGYPVGIPSEEFHGNFCCSGIQDVGTQFLMLSEWLWNFQCQEIPSFPSDPGNLIPDVGMGGLGSIGWGRADPKKFRWISQGIHVLPSLLCLDIRGKPHRKPHGKCSFPSVCCWLQVNSHSQEIPAQRELGSAGLNLGIAVPIRKKRGKKEFSPSIHRD